MWKNILIVVVRNCIW